MGKQDRHRDPSAIVTVAAYPGEEASDGGEYRLFFVLDASISRRHPHRIIDDIARLHRLRRYCRHGVEAVQFQELFADIVEEEIPDLHVTKITPVSDKRLRIQKLSLYVSTGRMLFNRTLTSLYDQLRYFPHARHDDGPDALALCMEAITERGWRLLSPSLPTGSPRQKGPYQQQLEAGLGDVIDFDEYGTDLTCESCAYLNRRPGQLPWCSLRLFATANTNRACDFYDYSGE
jgi:predicted phage terminase large subunit-like protein